MKKFLALLLALAMVLALAACGGNNSDAQTDEPQTQDEPTDADTPAETETEAEPEPEPAPAPTTDKYTYDEDRGDFTVTWTVMLTSDGTFSLMEYNGMRDTTDQIAGTTWTDNGDGTVTTGAWADPSLSKSDFFAEDGTCTWTLNSDGTCTPAGVEAEENPAAAVAGNYTYDEDRGDFIVTWTVMLDASGVFNLREYNGMRDTTDQIAGTTWTLNEDGTVTTGAWADPSLSKSDFFAEDGTCTWTLNEDGTCTPAGV